jgi:hypothetical protein
VFLFFKGDRRLFIMNKRWNPRTSMQPELYK